MATPTKSHLRRTKLFRSLQKSTGAQAMKSLANLNHDQKFGKAQAQAYRNNLQAQHKPFTRSLKAFVRILSA